MTEIERQAYHIAVGEQSVRILELYNSNIKIEITSSILAWHKKLSLFQDTNPWSIPPTEVNIRQVDENYSYSNIFGSLRTYNSYRKY